MTTAPARIPRQPNQPSELERAFETHIIQVGAVGYRREYMFHSSRRWKFDFCWPEYMLAVELEGKTWGEQVRCHACGARVMKRTKTGKLYPVREAGGRHARGEGFAEDCTKYNEATLLGWRVLRFTADQVADGTAVKYVEAALRPLFAAAQD